MHDKAVVCDRMTSSGVQLHDKAVVLSHPTPLEAGDTLPWKGPQRPHVGGSCAKGTQRKPSTTTA